MQVSDRQIITVKRPIPDNQLLTEHLRLSLSLGTQSIFQSVHFWINDALMAVLFLTAGRTIRRELHEGTLARSQKVIPTIHYLLGAWSHRH